MPVERFTVVLPPPSSNKKLPIRAGVLDGRRVSFSAAISVAVRTRLQTRTSSTAPLNQEPAMPGATPRTTGPVPWKLAVAVREATSTPSR